MQWPRFQMSQAAEDQNLHCLSGLRANFAKFSFQKYPQRPAITRRGQSHTLTPWPVTQARLAQHVELTVTRVTTHSGQPGSLAPARVTRSSPQSITLLSPPRSPQPESLAAARRHPQRPAATCRGPPQSTRPRHSPRPVSLECRSGPPLLAAARLTDSVTRRRSGAKAEVYDSTSSLGSGTP